MAKGFISWRGSVKRVCTLLLLLATVGGTGAGEITCHTIRYTFLRKNLDVTHVPKSPQQGIHLQICPRGVTCCTPEMESKLWTLSREMYTSALTDTASHVPAQLQQKSKEFEEFFRHLLQKSKRDFHWVFKKTYGLVYERNSDVFTDFFKDLEAYYAHGTTDLEAALDKFFTQLYQRMFTVLNAQFTFNDSYLQCVSRNMKELQPFGDIPKKLSLRLRRSFVATRTFSQALQEGQAIVAKILKIGPMDACTQAVTKMVSCQKCQSLPAIRPCTDYCTNVMNGCLAYHTTLANTWDKYIDSLISVGERLIGPFNIEAVVHPIAIRISDAIMNFQDSGFEVTEKVFQYCGSPKRTKRQASWGYGKPIVNHHPISSPTSSSSMAADQSAAPSTAWLGLDTLVNDILTSVKGLKGFWQKLPYAMCDHPDVGSGKGSRVDNNCWNGRERGTYQQRIVSNGLASQEQNPHVDIDIHMSHAEINEQMFALRLVTHKLEKAYNGHVVEWEADDTKYPNDSGYYGSGHCDDDEDSCVDGSDGSGDGSGGGRGAPWDDSDDGDDWRDDTGGSGDGRWSGETVPEAPSEPEPAWPPWTNQRQPPSAPSDIAANRHGNTDRDIVIDDSGASPSDPWSRRRGQTGGGGGEGSHSSGSGGSLAMRLLVYCLPVLLCYLGAFLS